MLKKQMCICEFFSSGMDLSVWNKLTPCKKCLFKICRIVFSSNPTVSVTAREIEMMILTNQFSYCFNIFEVEKCPGYGLSLISSRPFNPLCYSKYRVCDIHSPPYVSSRNRSRLHLPSFTKILL